MLCERGTLSESLKSRGHVPPVSPVPPGSYVHVYICANGSKIICESSPYHRHVPVECGSGKNFYLTPSETLENALLQNTL